MNVTEEDLRAFERLLLAAGLINLAVVCTINPLHADRVPERFPTIVQDFLVVGLVLLAGTFLSDKLIAASAIGAVVVGFGMQDTLGNAFAGLAIQSEAPFRIGHWVRVGEFEGRVAEMTWRATKLRTKTGNFVVVPNSKIAAEAVVNYSEPAVPTRLELEVGASYLAAPNLVKAAIVEAAQQVPQVLEIPPPDALLLKFDDFAIAYRARVWVVDYEFDDEVKDKVRRAIYYAFSRHRIEIPWPLHVEYEKEFPERDAGAELRQREGVVASIDLFAELGEEERRDLARQASMKAFGSGEAIVREGEPGQSMFVVCRGTAAVVTGSERREVASIGAGGYFGEMSLLTGEPRSATVLARGDTSVLELQAASLGALAARSPAAMERIAVLAAGRRLELNHVQEEARSAAGAVAPATILEKMRQFLRFGQRHRPSR
jgi:CRP-like cAMP-binding protein